MAENTRDRVLAALHERFPCAEVPLGTWRSLAAEVGVTPERVRQIAAEAGWTQGSIRTRPLPVCQCGKPVQRAGATCLGCRWITVACDQCGRDVRRRVTDIVRVRNRDHRYTGRMFCQQSCFWEYRRGKPRVLRSLDRC